MQRSVTPLLSSMNSRSRRWLRFGLGLGAAIAGTAYCWHRRRVGTASFDRDGATTDREPITERHTGAFLVRRRLEPDRLESVRAALERRRDEHAEHAERDETDEHGADCLLGVDGATTASLFLDRNGDAPELVWYVEVPWTAVEAWDEDPTTTLANAFPVTREAVREVDDDESVDRELLVHAVHPSRPERVVPADATASERADREDEPTADVELVRMDLESGFPERLADWFAGLSRRAIDGELKLDRTEAWSIEMLEAEDMFTESIFLERRVDGYSLVQYMETAEMAGVYDAYYDTWNPVARASDLVLGCVLEDPDVILSYPLDTDVELLAHATDPDRPRRASECGRGRSLDESMPE